MAENQTLREGQAYCSPKTGDLMLYVRQEQRPGYERPQHFFVSTHGRTVFHQWLELDDPTPEEWELAFDPEAENRERALERRIAELEIERAALTEAMQTAVGVVPVPVANHLRDVYRKHRGEALKGLGR